MWVRITSNIFRLRVSVLNTGAGTGFIRTSSGPVKWHYRIRSIHNISFKSASMSLTNILDKIILSIQLGNLQVCLHFTARDKLAVRLQIRKLSFNRSVNGIFPIDRRIVSIQSRLVVIILEYIPKGSAGCIIEELGNRTNIDDRQDKMARTCKNTAKFKSVCISHGKQRRTHIQFTPLQCDVRCNVLTDLRDCQCPMPRLNKNTRCKLLEESHNTAERNIRLPRNRPTSSHCLPWQSCNHHLLRIGIGG